MIPNITYTTKNKLCTGCGVCEGACPSKAIHITIHDNNFEPFVDNTLCKNSLGCHRCYDICPGIGCKIKELSDKKLNYSQTKNDFYIGNYITCFTGYSKDFDIRYHSASGGMITQVLIWLLEKSYIQGAYVTKFEPSKKFLVQSFIATTKEELLSAKSSKYSPVSLNSAIKEIKSRIGKFVIVGLPCHIQGFRKYEDIDHDFRSKVFAYFGLYCASQRSFSFTEYICKERDIFIPGLNYLSYRDEGNLGSLVAKGVNNTGAPFIIKDSYKHYSHPLGSIFVPTRCNLCIDHYAELADVSFGDIHIDPYKNDTIGINSLVVRNPHLLKLLLQAADDNVIVLNCLDVNLLNKSQPSAKRKKNNNCDYLRIERLLGKNTPIYDTIEVNSIKIKKNIIQYLITRFQQLIGSNKFFWFLIPFLKKIR